MIIFPNVPKMELSANKIHQNYNKMLNNKTRIPQIQIEIIMKAKLKSMELFLKELTNAWTMNKH